MDTISRRFIIAKGNANELARTGKTIVYHGAVAKHLDEILLLHEYTCMFM